MLNFEFFKDLFIGTLICLISMLLIIILSNNAANLLKKIGLHSFFILFVHLLIIIGFVYVVRHSLTHIINDKELFNSIIILTGSTIGATSLYFSPVLKDFALKYNFD